MSTLFKTSISEEDEHGSEQEETTNRRHHKKKHSKHKKEKQRHKKKKKSVDDVIRSQSPPTTNCRSYSPSNYHSTSPKTFSSKVGQIPSTNISYCRSPNFGRSRSPNKSSSHSPRRRKSRSPRRQDFLSIRRHNSRSPNTHDSQSLKRKSRSPGRRVSRSRGKSGIKRSGSGSQSIVIRSRYDHQFSHRVRRSRSRSFDRKEETVAKWHSLVVDTYNPLKVGSIDGTDTIPHDQAVVRAMESSHRPNKGVVGSPKCTIFIGRLAMDTDEDELSGFIESEFKVKVVSCRLVRELVTGQSRRYAFVQLPSSKDCRYVLEKASENVVLHDTKLIIEPEYGRSLAGWKPRRLGGGLGGYKESGQLRFGGRARPFRKPITVPGFSLERRY